MFIRLILISPPPKKKIEFKTRVLISIHDALANAVQEIIKPASSACQEAASITHTNTHTETCFVGFKFVPGFVYFVVCLVCFAVFIFAVKTFPDGIDE